MDPAPESFPQAAALPDRGTPPHDVSGASRDFRGLSRSIIRRTTDLVVIGVVLAAGMTAARELIGWWRAAPPGSTPARQTTVLFDEQGYTFEFGASSMAMDRAAVNGGHDAAVAALVDRCGQAARIAPLPVEPPEPAERALLQHTSRLRPAAEEAGCAVYHVEDQLEFVVAVRQSRAPPGNPDARRVVSWGLAAPRDESQWSIYTFTRSREGRDAPSRGVAVPLPENARRSLAFFEPGGASVTGFHGGGPAPRWMRFFDGWFAAQRARPGGEWRQTGQSWGRQYAGTWHELRWVVDVQFAAEPGGNLSGLVIVALDR